MKMHLEIDPDDPRDVERLADVARKLGAPVTPGQVIARKPARRGPTLPKAPTPEEKARAEAHLDEPAWSRYEKGHSTKRTA